MAQAYGYDNAKSEEKEALMKKWEDKTADEKIESLRHEMKIITQQIGRVADRLEALFSKFEGHVHTPDGDYAVKREWLPHLSNREPSGYRQTFI